MEKNKEKIGWLIAMKSGNVAPFIAEFPQDVDVVKMLGGGDYQVILSGHLVPKSSLDYYLEVHMKQWEDCHI